MKTLEVYLIMLIIACTSLFAQDGWIVLDTGAGEDLWTCRFITEQLGFAAGEKGIIVKTTNGGQNWEITQFPSSHSFYSSTYNNGTIWIVGTIVIYSTDYGLNWNTVDQFGNTTFRKIKFLNSNLGFLVGNSNYIYKTSDAGQSWHPIEVEPPQISYESISIINENVFYLFGSSEKLYKTTDGGISWALIGNYAFIKLEFVSQTDGWGLRHSHLFNSFIQYTSNGGFDWENRLYFPPGGNNILDFHFVNSQKGFAVGDFGNIWITENGGQTWSLQHISPVFFLNEISMLNELTGYISGSSGMVLKSTTGGVSSFEGDNFNLFNFKLYQNYPNPFNPATTIGYQMPDAGYITLKIFDVLGNEISTLVNEYKPAGRYEVNFDASSAGGGLASGVYFYQLRAGNFVKTMKMILLQ